MSNFSAAPQTLGYLHQVRYALVILLDREESKLRLEELDDIDLATPGAPQDLLQLKHRAPGTTLTNASADLWKTLRIWATQVGQGTLDLDQALLSLVTTAHAPDGSAAALLRADSNRDPGTARAILAEIARTSDNKDLKLAFSAFLKLPPGAQERLMSRIYVLDGGPTIADARKLLEARLSVAVRREHRAALADRVEGWWFQRCIAHLRREVLSLSGFEVCDKIVELAQQFQPDALPIDFLAAKPTSVESTDLTNRQFVRQLRCLDVSAGRIQNAVIDYYRAYAQRSRWARDDLLVGDELERYEERLCDEWNRMRLSLVDELDQSFAEEHLRKLGRELLSWMESSANVRIRANVAEPYIMRGSYHILADGEPPYVWWHPEFVERIKRLVDQDDQ